MPWLKYHDAPIMNGEQWDRDQPKELSSYGKPAGFWITDDSEHCWRQWCEGEQWGLERLTHKHEIDLDESGILMLRNSWELDDFSREFGVEKWWGPNEQPRRYRDWCIDWRKVAEQHTGIIITPYHWSQRMNLQWYYGWDCACGCIWKASAIREIRLIEINMDLAKPREPYRDEDETEAA